MTKINVLNVGEKPVTYFLGKSISLFMKDGSALVFKPLEYNMNMKTISGIDDYCMNLSFSVSEIDYVTI